jgi:hypothetical protein
MYIGHFAPAFIAAGASAEAPRLGTLFVAAQLIDLAFFPLVLAGVEHMRIVPGITAMNPFDLHHMPYTHSLAAATLWGLALGAVVWRRLGTRAAAAWAAMVVLSHWLLDLLVHRPDLTIAGAPPKLGFGLWNSPLLAIPLELALVGLTFWYYLKRTRGPLGPPLILFTVMLAFQGANWFGPQPTAMSAALPVAALASFAILIALAHWVGTSRTHRRAAGLATGRLRR